MHNSQSMLDNKTQKILWDFDIKTDHLISARWPDLVSVNNKQKTCRIVQFGIPTELKVKLKVHKTKDKYRDLASELKKNYGRWKW